MKKIFTLAAAALFTWCAATAVPAKPGFRTVTQSDGTQVAVQAVGDEFFHYYVTQDGLPIDMDDNGSFYYLTARGLSSVLAHNADSRDASELSFIQGQMSSMRQALSEAPRHQARRASARRKVGQTQVPTMGSPRVPILLVQYTNKKMANSKEAFEAHYKTAAKSVYQYFVDQSNGKYTPQYDIYGIYDLPGTRATYGGNDDSGNDKGVAQMVCDAIDTAGDEIDWSLYDNDGDGEADVCIVVYAGPGEAQGGPKETVWPCQWELESGAYYNDGDGARNRNGVKINRFAVFNETVGSSDNGTTMDGIGTFCHEFSHCLGLPDFYETTYGNGYFGMGGWSLMNSGCYNGGAVSGDTPIGYSAYEKNFMDWIEYVEPVPNTHYTLPVFNAKNIDTDQAIKITSHLNDNEYFILENRRKQGWDQYIADEGVLITHFTYVANRWAANTVNNEAIQLATIIPADNTTSSYSESGDLYGETNHSFTSTSTPASRLNMRANGSLASSVGGAGTLDKPVTDIVLNNDGTASLWYIKSEMNVEPGELVFKAPKGSSTTATFKVTGKALPQDMQLTLNDEAGVFSVDKATLTPAEVEAGAQVTVTFAPQEMGNYAGIITLTCEGLEPLTVTLTGEGLIESETPVMLAADTLAITPHSFLAEWTDGSPAQNVKSYTLYVNYKPQYELLYDKSFTGWRDVTETYWYWTDYTDIADNLGNYDLQGWTGTHIFSHDGYMQIGDRQSGWSGNNYAGNLTSPQFDLTQYDGKVTIVAEAKAVASSTNLTFALGRGTSVVKSQAVAMTTSGKSYTVVLDGVPYDNAFMRLSTTTSRPVQLTSLKVYAGEYSEENANAPLLMSVEQGDSLHRIVEGITDLSYTVNDLKAYGTYYYQVEAIYINDTRSEKSNAELVTLRDVVKVSLLGDVNNDGVVDIADVNILINIMLGKDSAGNYDERAYVTEGDKVVDIADVNAVINIMLNKN